ncbi:MAG: ureidoglycolate lyase [Gammaproteobacteria bacterium]|nr:ureidoglycolate lyase [Gammaproteobacteria bacterium]
MTRRVLIPEALSSEAFAPFGEVIDSGGKSQVINAGYTDRFHGLTKIDAQDLDGEPVINIFRSRPRPEPLEISFLERHPLGSQAFVPLAGTPFLVVTALYPESDALRLFQSNGKQGINYRKGVWHYPLLVLGREAEFLVIDRAGPGENCEVAKIVPPVMIRSWGG